uniref:hypothetical protein n=1 Tax=Leptospira interrogans TaxID=173 RepID=UPI001C3F675C
FLQIKSYLVIYELLSSSIMSLNFRSIPTLDGFAISAKYIRFDLELVQNIYKILENSFRVITYL